MTFYTTEQWDKACAAVLLPDDVTPLNAGSCSPGLAPMMSKMADLRLQQAKNPVGFIWGDALPLIEESRSEFAKLLNCDSNHLLLLENVSFAANMVVNSLDLQPGDEILLTDQEYHHFETLWSRFAKKKGLRLRTIHVKTQLDSEYETENSLVEKFSGAITTSTKVIFVSHVAPATGTVLPVAKICQLARRQGIRTIVDGAHALAAVEVDLQAIGADFYIGTAHKWLMGPIGSGYLYCDPSCKVILKPLITTAAWEYDRARLDEQIHNKSGKRIGTPWQHALEYHGTQDRVPHIGLTTSIDFMLLLGLDAVRARCRSMQQKLYAEAVGNGLEPVSFLGLKEVGTPRPLKGDDRCLTTSPMMSSFSFGDMRQVNRIRAENYFLNHYGIQVAFPPLAQRGVCLRISSAWFNREKDFQALKKFYDDGPSKVLAQLT